MKSCERVTKAQWIFGAMCKQGELQSQSENSVTVRGREWLSFSEDSIVGVQHGFNFTLLSREKNTQPFHKVVQV